MLYLSSYSDDELDKWANRIFLLSKDLNAMHIYFNNDAEGFAVRNAQTLSRKLRENSFMSN
jgi:uncharacterized protein YecE (DUF72 family)